ncbi:MAG TPA: hypothetical protein VK272_01045 [Solirubrobacteraceae bacterium]|nr:hypothetical protein [Solirubrobacteraceae bacterium]
MGFALVVRELSRRRALLVLGVLIAAAAAVLSVYRVSGGKLQARSLQYSSATTQALVDSPKSALGSLSQSFEPLSDRAAVYANFMASPAVLKLVGQQVGLSGEQIYAAGPVSAAQPRVVQEPTALKRNVEITGEANPYRLNFESQTNLPTINIYAQAPSTSQAVALANAAVVGLQQYVDNLETSNKIPPNARVTIRQLGAATGSVVNGGVSTALAVLVGIGVFVLWCVLILAGSRFRRLWRESAQLVDLGESKEGALADHDDAGEPRLDAPLQGIPVHPSEGERFDDLPQTEDEHSRVPARSFR